MLKYYEEILENYKRIAPTLYDITVECRPSGKHSILATLTDGSIVEFYSDQNTIRDVTKYYNQQYVDNMDEESWRKEFGRRLRVAIYDAGINQEMLSDMTGISRQMLTRYVRGNSTPSAYNIARLAKVLNRDIREFTRLNYLEE